MAAWPAAPPAESASGVSRSTTSVTSRRHARPRAGAGIDVAERAATRYSASVDMPASPQHTARIRVNVRRAAAGVLSSVCPWLRQVGLAVVLLAVPTSALAQASGGQADDEGSPPPTYTPDARTLARIQSVLDAESPVRVRVDGLTFFLSVSETRPTFTDYLRGTGRWFEISPIEPPSGNRYDSRLPAGSGVDLLSIFRSMNRALEERKARQIRQQIDRELDAIDRGR